MIVPTRGRPASAVRLARAVNATFSPRATTLVFVVDADDPERERYAEDLGREAPWADLLGVPGGPRAPRRLGPVLNYAAAVLCPDCDYLGFMGDDHLPRTPLWDERLCGALGDRPGVAYGDDLLQGARLPTACVISAGLVRVLGYMAPPVLEHLFLDDFWKELGQATRLIYRPDVIIEHCHPAAGKAPLDRGYAENGLNGDLLRDDGRRWAQWREQVWPGEVRRLRRVLGAAVCGSAG